MKVVVAGLVMKNGQCLIAKRRVGDALANLWEFPGGKLEAGETPEECLRREIREELEIDVEIGSFFAKTNYKYEFGKIELLVYWVHWQGETLSSTVHDEIAWVNPQTICTYTFVPADIPIVEKLICCNEKFK